MSTPEYSVTGSFWPPQEQTENPIRRESTEKIGPMLAFVLRKGGGPLYIDNTNCQRPYTYIISLIKSTIISMGPYIPTPIPLRCTTQHSAGGLTCGSP